MKENKAKLFKEALEALFSEEDLKWAKKQAEMIKKIAKDTQTEVQIAKLIDQVNGLIKKVEQLQKEKEKEKEANFTTTTRLVQPVQLGFQPLKWSNENCTTGPNPKDYFRLVSSADFVDENGKQNEHNRVAQYKEDVKNGKIDVSKVYDDFIRTCNKLGFTPAEKEALMKYNFLIACREGKIK